MQTTTHTDREQTEWRARVAVRVPRDGTGELATDAARRLESPTGIEHVGVENLSGLEPALAATVAQLEVRLTTTERFTQGTVEGLLESAPGTERVEGVSQVDSDMPAYGTPP